MKRTPPRVRESAVGLPPISQTLRIIEGPHLDSSPILESEQIDGTIKSRSQGENEKNVTQRHKPRPAANNSQESSTNSHNLDILEILNNKQIQLSEQKNENYEIRIELKRLQKKIHHLFHHHVRSPNIHH
ncbi:hypothetical protein GcM3_016029 [Golovinomyces cichoracearum]|uniref:Uncharacterized protein n=1 Tax=Golovinomyces cichoracearum TaxID=62708 RepID=A0A420J8R0_9PEZI|nr:hypothetical protein GcM3_016029 [Golovinomyces cichoracearum]